MWRSGCNLGERSAGSTGKARVALPVHSILWSRGTRAFRGARADQFPGRQHYISPCQYAAKIAPDRIRSTYRGVLHVRFYTTVSVPIFTLSLSNLAAILDKAAGHAENKKIDPKVLPAARLIIDMLPLSSQVQIACDTAKGAAARLAGIEVPKHPDTETTIDELKARVAKTLDFIKTVKREQFQGAETRKSYWRSRSRP